MIFDKKATTIHNNDNKLFLDGQRLLRSIRKVPKFDEKEIVLGKFLGRGGFSDVSEIRGFLLQNNLILPSKYSTTTNNYTDSTTNENGSNGNCNSDGHGDVKNGKDNVEIGENDAKNDNDFENGNNINSTTNEKGSNGNYINKGDGNGDVKTGNENVGNGENNSSKYDESINKNVKNDDDCCNNGNNTDSATCENDSNTNPVSGDGGNVKNGADNVGNGDNDVSKHDKNNNENLKNDDDCNNGKEHILNNIDCCIENDKESRDFIAEHCIRQSGDARYALKALRPLNRNDPEAVESALKDLAIEVQFLTKLSHPNIIKLRAIAANVTPYDEKFFLVLDRLYDTLHARMIKWSEQKRKLNTIIGRCVYFRSRKTMKFAFLDQRLAAAFDLSAALEYLHKKQIVHRDIKPQNIGFDIRDDIKLFDFGLSRELEDKDKDRTSTGMKNSGTSTYKLSHMTGSLRYMAPEVALGQSYNTLADIYSLSIVIWEMISLERSFRNITNETQFMNYVFKNNNRPPIKQKWSFNIKKMFTVGWESNLYKRCSAVHIKNCLFAEILGLREGDNSGLEHDRRRSTFIKNGSDKGYNLSASLHAGSSIQQDPSINQDPSIQQDHAEMCSSHSQSSGTKSTKL